MPPGSAPPRTNAIVRLFQMLILFSILSAFAFAGMLAWEVYNGPKNNVEVGMTLQEAFTSMGNIKTSSVVVTEVLPADSKLLKKDPNYEGKQYFINFREEKYALAEMQPDGIHPLGSYGTLEEVAAQLQNRFAERKDSSWHVTVVCVTSPVTRTAFGYMLSPDFRVYFVSPISYRGPS